MVKAETKMVVTRAWGRGLGEMEEMPFKDTDLQLVDKEVLAI